MALNNFCFTGASKILICNKRQKFWLSAVIFKSLWQLKAKMLDTDQKTYRGVLYEKVKTIQVSKHESKWSPVRKNLATVRRKNSLFSGSEKWDEIRDRQRKNRSIARPQTNTQTKTKEIQCEFIEFPQTGDLGGFPCFKSAKDETGWVWKKCS